MTSLFYLVFISANWRSSITEVPKMTHTTILLENYLDRLKNGDQKVRDELIAVASRRLQALAERMLREFPRVARWDQSDDVFQQAAMRLRRALGEVVPDSPEAFLRLGALQIRRELIDMARHYYGPNGIGANRSTASINGTARPEQLRNQSLRDSGFHSDRLEFWAEFHSSVDKLPEMEKLAFDLLWYYEMTQPEAAKLLQVSVRQLRRYWLSARLRLQKLLTEFARPR